MNFAATKNYLATFLCRMLPWKRMFRKQKSRGGCDIPAGSVSRVMLYVGFIKTIQNSGSGWEFHVPHKIKQGIKLLFYDLFRQPTRVWHKSDLKRFETLNSKGFEWQQISVDVHCCQMEIFDEIKLRKLFHLPQKSKRGLPTITYTLEIYTQSRNLNPRQ